MIKRIWFVIPLVLILTGCATCGKKVKDLETRVQTLENKGGMQEAPSQEQTAAEALLPVSASEQEIPSTPSKTDIQTALKNGGFYTGEIDGKIGHKTKEAIKEFQRANGLKVDGKVGPKTWDKLKNYFFAR